MTVDPDDRAGNAGFGANLSQEDDERLTILSRLHGIYFVSDRDAKLAELFGTLAERLVINDRMAATRTRSLLEGRQLVVVGEPGAGKSSALDRLFRRHPNLPGYGIRGSGCPLVTVNIEAPCTLKRLGEDILDEIGYPLSADRSEKQVWKLVMQKLEMAGVRVLHLDEANSITSSAKADEAIRIRNTLKSLLNSKTYPVCLVLSGLPEIADFFKGMAENNRRSLFFALETLTASDCEAIHEMLSEYARVAGLMLDPDALQTIVPRLVHASTNQLGIAIELIIEAIDRVLRAGERMLTRGHFAAAYADRTGNSAMANPFVTDEWADVDCTAVLLDRAPSREPALPMAAPKRRRRVRGDRTTSQDNSRGF